MGVKAAEGAGVVGGDMRMYTCVNMLNFRCLFISYPSRNVVLMMAL